MKYNDNTLPLEFRILGLFHYLGYGSVSTEIKAIWEQYRRDYLCTEEEYQYLYCKATAVPKAPLSSLS